jgi:tricarballylate dehydrogenase
LRMKQEIEYDVLIIGAGAAGTSAAVSAAETAKNLGKTAKIVIVDRSNEKEWGGNSRFTTAFFRMTDEDHLDPDLVQDLLTDSKGKFDREYAITLAENALETIRWARSKGVAFEERAEKSILPFGNKVNIHASGGGLAIITALRKEAESLGVSILLETTAYRLSLDQEGRVDGAWVRNVEGKARKISCKAMILAGGGFNNNLEMLTRYMGKDAAELRPDVPELRSHMGECINMALDVGAAPSGEYGNYHGMVVDSRTRAFAPNILAYIYGILINVEGRRFTDEGEENAAESFEAVSKRIFAQPDHKAYLILDKSAISIPNFGKLVFSKVAPIEAQSLEELASMIKVPRAELERTVLEYNAAIQPGEIDPKTMDGKHTLGLRPPKSNWAMPIEVPPFFCYPVEGTLQFTWGGIASDTKARVLATNGSPIQGLYVAGEMVGQNYHHYSSGTSVMRSLVFGRIAGCEAVKRASLEGN